jgi:hypothetical protein
MARRSRPILSSDTLTLSGAPQSSGVLRSAASVRHFDGRTSTVWLAVRVRSQGRSCATRSGSMSTRWRTPSCCCRSQDSMVRAEWFGCRFDSAPLYQSVMRTCGSAERVGEPAKCQSFGRRSCWNWRDFGAGSTKTAAGRPRAPTTGSARPAAAPRSPTRAPTPRRTAINAARSTPNTARTRDFVRSVGFLTSIADARVGIPARAAFAETTDEHLSDGGFAK